MLNIVFVGEPNVGKSTLIIRLVKGTFDSELQSTMGVQFFKTVIKDPINPLELHIWDTAGTEVQGSYIPNKLKSADIVVVVYQIDKKESLLKVDDWIDIIKNNSKNDVPILLIGNKTDLSDRAVETNEAIEFSKGKVTHLIEVSAKTGNGVDQIYDFLKSVRSTIVYHRRKNRQNDEPGCC